MGLLARSCGQEGGAQEGKGGVECGGWTPFIQVAVCDTHPEVSEAVTMVGGP